MTNREEHLRAYVTVDNLAKAPTDLKYHLPEAGYPETRKALESAQFKLLGEGQEPLYRQEKRNMAIVTIMTLPSNTDPLSRGSMVLSGRSYAPYYLPDKDYATAIHALETACFVKFDRFDELNS